VYAMIRSTLLMSTRALKSLFITGASRDLVPLGCHEAESLATPHPLALPMESLYSLVTWMLEYARTCQMIAILCAAWRTRAWPCWSR
jgi:hypothetical protein